MTEELPKNHLQVLSQLALEYQRKSRDLQVFLADADPQSAPGLLLARGELTTSRFRQAQQALLAALLADTDSPHSRELLFSAAVTLCRCFDEMRILLQAMADEAERGPA